MLRAPRSLVANVDAMVRARGLTRNAVLILALEASTKGAAAQ